MNLFSRLRHHAQNQPEAIAASSRFRMMTYRKLWSRVERATARLQGEWGVRRGDTIAYRGQAHPDAIVLYLALARCGAKLVAFEQPALSSGIDAIVRQFDIKIMVCDDEMPLDPAHFPAAIRSLSSLIMTRCPCQPSDLDEASDCPSLIMIGLAADHSVQMQPASLDQMAARKAVALNPLCHVAESLFDEHVFISVVLPALTSGATLHFL